jgi:collagen type III alpha
MTGVNTGWFETTAVVISRGEDKALVYDLEAMAKVGEIALPGTPETGVTTPDGTKLYVALSGTGQVAVIDMRRRALVKMIDDVGDEPWGTTMLGALNYCH